MFIINASVIDTIMAMFMSIETLDGFKYEGDWRDGCPNGQGTIYWPGGKTYAGQWIDGLPNGHGTMMFPDGNIIQGQWYYYERDGQGLMDLLAPPTDEQRDDEEELDISALMKLLMTPSAAEDGAVVVIKKTCSVCGVSARADGSGKSVMKCSRCKSSDRYCGSACQKQDWSRHKNFCKNVCGV